MAMVPERSSRFVEAEPPAPMRREMLEEPLLQVEDADGRSVSLIDLKQRHYYDSQEASWGRPTRPSRPGRAGVLGVPGGPTLLLTRSTGFNSFLDLFTSQWPDPKDIFPWTHPDPVGLR